jgi:hypothetical protein
MWAALTRQPVQSAASNAQPDPLLSVALGMNMIEDRDHCQKNCSFCGLCLLSGCDGGSSISVTSSGAPAISRRQAVPLGPWGSDVHGWAGGQQYNFALYFSSSDGTTWNGVLEPYPAQLSDTTNIRGYAISALGILTAPTSFSRTRGQFGFQNKRMCIVRFSERVFDFQNRRKNPLFPGKRFMVYKPGLNLLCLSR